MKKVNVLSFVLFISSTCAIGQSTVDIDFNYRTGTGIPEVFGTCNYGGNTTVQDGLNDQGFSSARVDVSIDGTLSKTFCPTIEYWKANQNNVQDESLWTISNSVKNLANARRDSMSTILIMDYMPDFLSYSYSDSTQGKFGMPKDWNIWQSIVKKIYARCKNYGTYFEIWNEPNVFLTLEGSPYQNMVNGRAIAFADLYYYTASAIRSVDSQAKIGGPGFAWGGPTDGKNNDIFQALIRDSRIKAENLFNFLSFHEYPNGGAYIITNYLTSYQNEMAKYGYIGLPAFIDEYNVGNLRNETFYNERAHSWHGKNLIACIRAGVGSNYYATGNLNSGGYGNYYQSGSVVTMAHFTNSWKLPGRILGLRKGKYDVFKTTWSGTSTYPTVTAATAAVNSDGQKIWLIANDDLTEKDVIINLNNVNLQTGDSILFWVSAGDVDVDKCNKLNFTISGTNAFSSFKIPAYSLVGFKIKKQTISAVKSVRNDNLKIYTKNNGIKLSQSANIEVFNFSGTKVTGKENSDEIDLASGLYIVKAITSEGLVYTDKVIVK